MKKFFSCLLILFLIFGVYGVNAATLYSKELNSKAVYFVDMDTNLPIIEKNINEHRSPASLTKIMTFIVAYELAEDVRSTKITVRQEALDQVDPESSGVKLKGGEELKLMDLLSAMLICSSGDAAMVIADYFGGGNVQNFVNKMNEKAGNLGCTDTHFANPDGFYNENQYSTAADIYKIAKYAMNFPDFLSIVSKSECNIFGDERDPIITTNMMIDSKRGGKYYYPYVRGIKTGYCNEAGKCLASYAQKNGKSYMSVVMGGPVKDSNGNKIQDNMAMIDTKNIYTWAFDELKSAKLYSKNSPIDEIPMEFVWNHDKLLLVPENDFSVSLPANFNKKEISLKTYIPEKVEAPINRGDVVGKADVFYKNELIGSFNVVSSDSFKKNYLLVIIHFFKNIISSPIFFIIFSVIIVLFVICLWRFLIIRKRRRRRGKIKRFPSKRR